MKKVHKELKMYLISLMRFLIFLYIRRGTYILKHITEVFMCKGACHNKKKMLLLDEKYLGKYFMAILASTLWTC